MKKHFADHMQGAFSFAKQLLDYWFPICYNTHSKKVGA